MIPGLSSRKARGELWILPCWVSPHWRALNQGEKDLIYANGITVRAVIRLGGWRGRLRAEGAQRDFCKIPG